MTALLMRLNADVADYNVEPDRAVWLACDLLVAGLDTPALRELAGESPSRLEKSEAGALVGQFLAELGIKPMTREEADWFIGREVAWKVLGGAPRAEWEDDTWRVNIRLATESGSDDVFAAAANYDSDSGPYLGFMRDYLRLAEAQLTEW
ncbi:hypothetical protein LFM09_24965 [Lentzea alba]|uniref:hypothetical protein n=1 Tax=Lentzea alba TaxID=2714351 RepID=UPI0039BF7965